MRRRHRLLCAAAVSAALLGLPALASADCGDQILSQATQQGAVTGKFPLRCYDLALSKIDPDLEEYGEAPGIIRAAKAARRLELNAQDDPRDPAGVTTGEADQAPADGGGNEPSDGPAPTERSGDAQGTSGDAPDTSAVEPSSEDLTEQPADSTDASTVAATSFDDGDDGGPPTPVLLLGGAAIVLIGVGMGGMVYRRFLQR